MPAKLPRLAYIPICIALIVAFLPPVVKAAPPEEAVSVAIVLDNSGSMVETDPEQVRFIAARLMIDLLDPGDRVAVVSFSDEAQVIEPLTEIRGATERAALKKPLHRSRPGGDTNYRPAFQLASAQLAKAPAGQRAILFLTDGEMHPAGWDQWPAAKKDAEVAAVKDIAGRLGRQGGKLFPLSFKRFIPEGSALLSDLSTEGRGFYRQIDDMAALNSAFEAIYSSLKGQVFQGLSEICSPTPKTVLPSMRRMIVTMVSRAPGEKADLVPPRGFIGDIETRDDDEGFYRVLLVRNPTPGEWMIRPKAGQCVLVGSIDTHNIRVTPLAPADQVPTGEELRMRVKVEQQKAGSDAWEPLEDADVAADVTKPGSGAMRVRLAPTGGGIFEALLEAAAMLKGMYRLDTLVSSLGQVLSGIPPIPRYIEVGGFPKMDVKVTAKESSAKAPAAPGSGAAAGRQVAQALATISGDQPVSNRKINWRVLGPNGKAVDGRPSADGEAFDFDFDMDGLYLVSAVLEGAIQGERGPTPVKVTKEIPVTLVRNTPQLRWMLGERSKFQDDKPVTSVPLRAAFLSGTQPVHVDKPSLTVSIVGPQGQTDEIKLSPDGEAFGRSWTVEQSGAYTLTVKGEASYMEQPLSQSDTTRLQVQVAPAVALQLASKQWGGDWGDAPKRFTLQAKSNLAERVQLKLSTSEAGIAVTPTELTVQPGAAQRFDVSAQRIGQLGAGTRQVMLRVSSPAARVEPSDLSLGSIHVAGWLEALLLYLGIGVLVVGVIAVVWWLMRARRAAK